ncbi:MAG: UDP-3-O-(3-hydroxymyristoyl)glucosamine N-acyltransferase [Sediminibacterium sp.]|nr:UDP-3-O-(3-hydroxymyristoyl)glucosamine N-acyltransferase [Sediminibacterium sp.]
MTNFTAEQIAQLCNGRIIGDKNKSVHSFASLENAQNNQLSFLSNLKYEQLLYTSNAGIIIINDSYQIKHAIKATIIVVQNSYQSLALLMQQYEKLTTSPKTGIDNYVHIEPTANMGKNVYIGAFTYISKNVFIGDNCTIYPNTFIGDDVTIGNNTIINAGVKIYKKCSIGSNVIIHSGAVIGSDGFGFAPGETYQKIPQLGNVIIEDNVEIGANVTIDRATLDSTIIKKGVKLDNQIQIAHNVEIGENTVIAAQVGISGSTKIGKNSMIGGQTGIAGHLIIADGVKIAGQTGVTKSILQENSIVAGLPAVKIKDWQKQQIYIKQLADLHKRIHIIEKK